MIKFTQPVFLLFVCTFWFASAKHMCHPPANCTVMYESRRMTHKSDHHHVGMPTCPPFLCDKGCYIGGEFYYFGQQVPDNDPCEQCICTPKGIRCWPYPPDDCKRIMLDGECCPKYDCGKACWEKEHMYENGEMVPQPAGSCKECYCRNRRVVCNDIICPPPPADCCEEVHVEGQCCPKYDCGGGCHHNDVFYEDGEVVPTEDPCEHCYCSDKEVTCSSIKCPGPPDRCCDRIEVEGECCPKFDCKHDGCYYNDVFYANGETFEVDCLICTCRDNQTYCKKKDCPEDICNNGCFFNNHQYKEGEEIPTGNKCERCYCSNGHIVCEKLPCCEYKGEFYEIDETISQPDPCKHCVCTVNGIHCREVPCGCTVNRTYYENGDVVPNYKPCYHCVCNEREVDCVPLKDVCEKVHNKDECCPKYDCGGGCTYDGKFYTNGEMVPHPDPCDICYCTDGKISCKRKFCRKPADELRCTPYFERGECCPKWDCGGGCYANGLFFAEDGFYENGEKFFSLGDKCVICQCINGGFKCPLDQVECDTSCYWHGVFYLHGASVPTKNICENCHCHNGTVTCDKIDCCSWKLSPIAVDDRVQPN